MRYLLLGLLCHVLNGMHKGYESQLKARLYEIEKNMYEEKLKKVIEYAEKFPGKDGMCFREVMEVITPIIEIMNNPINYIKRCGGTGHADAGSSIRSALRLFFEQPLIMDMGPTVDDSILDMYAASKLNESLLESHRYFFRRNLMQKLKKILVGV